MFEEDRFVIKDKDGKDQVFYKLILFESSITNKSYIIYTDNTYTDNTLNLYGSILIIDGEELKLQEAKDEIDIQEINKAIIKVKVQLDNDSKH